MKAAQARLPGAFEPAWRRLGWPAAAGLLALVVAALLALGLQPAWRRSTEQQAQQLRLAQLARAAAPLPLPGASKPAAAWPPRAEREARLRHLVSLAGLHGLSLPRLALDPADERASGPHWQLLRMPLRGDYAGLRGFLADALADDPALALQALQLRAADGGGIEAELVWALGQRP